jgi:hypothetical protein
VGRTDYFDGLTPDNETARRFWKLRNIGDPSRAI